MRPYTSMLIIAALLIAAGASHASDRRGSIDYRGYTRTFVIHLPKGREEGKRYPLVVVLHGGGGAGRQMIRFTRFNDLADRDGCIVVYPDGVGRQWNDGRTIERSRAHSEQVDDVGFLAGLADYMVRRHGANAKRVYFAGISNGALMSYRMACEKPDRIAAIAAVAGNLPEHLASRAPSGPVPVIIINGTEDPLVPWSGGPVRVPFAPGQERGSVIAAPDTASYWARTNRCATPPSAVNLPDSDPGDGCRVIRHAYSGCAGGADVVLYEITGGGHTWPGGSQYLPVSIIGRVCKDINATELIWEFFKKHEKK